MEFSITAQNGDSVKIHAANWMAALGKALPFFSIDLSWKLICAPSGDGSVFIEAPTDGSTWMIREVEPAIKVQAAAASLRLPSVPPVSAPAEPSLPPPASGPAPAIAMPVQSSLRQEAPEVEADDEDEESLAERLFDLSFELTEAEPDRACQMGLDLILEFVPVEAASVVRGSLNDAALTFVAATGPVAADIVGKKVKFGAGLIGMCFDMKGTLVANDVRRDERHLESLDEKTGFESQVALCVPLLDADNRSFGVIQLLNPASGQFSEVDVETVESVATTLAGALSTHYSGVE